MMFSLENTWKIFNKELNVYLPKSKKKFVKIPEYLFAQISSFQLSTAVVIVILKKGVQFDANTFFNWIFLLNESFSYYV